MRLTVDFLYKLLIVCITFDGLFSRLIIPLNYGKYVIVACILYHVLKKTDFRFSIPLESSFLKLFVLLTFFSVIRSIPFFFDYGFVGFDVPKKYTFFIFSLICFYHSPLFGISNNKLLYFFAQNELVWSILNPILYFIKPFFLTERAGMWFGRISVGYPTIDVVLYAIAIAVFLFHEDNLRFYKRNVVFCIILFIGIFMQASGTGIVLSFVIIFFLLFSKCNHRFKWRKILFLFLGIFLSSVSAFTILQKKDAYLYEKSIMSIENRIGVLMGHSNMEMDVNTLEIRKDEFQESRKVYQNSLSTLFFGVGFGPLYYRNNKNECGYQYVFLENQFHVILFSMGYLGIIIFFIALGTIVYDVFVFTNVMLCCCCLIMSIAFFTSNVLMDFSLTTLLGLFMAIVKREKDVYILNQ